MSDSDGSRSGQAEENSFEHPDEAAKSSELKKSKLCALEAAADGEWKAGETTGKVTETAKLGKPTGKEKLE